MAGSRAAKLLLCALFLAGITLPGLALVCGWSPETGLGEKRELASLPGAPADRASLESYPRDFEAYYRDHFGFRSLLIRNYNRIFRRWLELSDTEVIVGKDGWLYLYTAAGEYRFADPLDEEDLVAWRANLEERHEYLERLGIDFVYVIVPNKDTVYPEFLPDARRTGPAVSRKEQLVASVAGTPLEPLDLLPAMLEAKRRHGLVYRRTDTHWNDQGAYVGYREILSHFAARQPALAPRPLSDFEEQHVTVSGGDLARMLALDDEVSEVIPRLVPKRPPRAVRVATPEYADDPWLVPEQVPFAMETGDPSLPRAVVFRDSFAALLVPTLSEHFSRIVYLWSNNLIGEIIEAEKPDVVIWEMGERYLLHPPPVNSEAVANLGPVFESGEPLLQIDAATARDELELTGGASWLDDAEGAVIQVRDRNARAVLPPVEADSRTRAILRLRFESLWSTYMRVYYGERDGSGFDREHSFMRNLRPGLWEFYFEIPTEDWNGELALMIGRSEGDYRLHSIELRRVDRPEEGGAGR